MNALLRLGAFLLLGAVSATGFAQHFPAKPIKFIVPFPAGGGTDFVARTIGTRLSESLGQPVVIDNRAGASGMIGVDAAAKSPADGYTVLIAGVGELTINPGLYTKIPYDTNRDFQGLTMLAKNPFLLVVNPAVLPVSNVQEFVQAAKRKPDSISYASFGPGSIAHVIAEAFYQKAGIKLVHVPYKGAAPAVQDLIGGQVATMFVDYGAAKGHIQSGRLRALAASTKERHPALPEVPSLAESGIANFDSYSWIGCVVPAGTPKDVAARLSQEILKIANSPAVQKQFSDYGVLPATSTPEQFVAFVKQEIDNWAGVTKGLGLKLD